MAAKIKPGEEFLGVGLFGPLRRSHTGEFETKAGRDLVAEGVAAILGTKAAVRSQGLFAAGERFMRDDFGSQAHTLRHETLDDDTVALVESFYVDAVETWEPRAFVKALRTELDEQNERMTTHLTAEILGTNEEINLVIIRNAQGAITFRSF